MIFSPGLIFASLNYKISGQAEGGPITTVKRKTIKAGLILGLMMALGVSVSACQNQQESDFYSTFRNQITQTKNDMTKLTSAQADAAQMIGKDADNDQQTENGIAKNLNDASSALQADSASIKQIKVPDGCDDCASKYKKLLDDCNDAANIGKNASKVEYVDSLVRNVRQTELSSLEKNVPNIDDTATTAQVTQQVQAQVAVHQTAAAAYAKIATTDTPQSVTSVISLLEQNEKDIIDVYSEQINNFPKHDNTLEATYSRKESNFSENQINYLNSLKNAAKKEINDEKQKIEDLSNEVAGLANN